MESLFSFTEFRKRTWRNDVSSMATRAVFLCLFVVGLLEKGKLFGADVDWRQKYMSAVRVWILLMLGFFWYFFLCCFCSFRVGKAIFRGGGYKLKLWLVSPLTGVVPLPNKWPKWLINGGYSLFAHWDDPPSMKQPAFLLFTCLTGQTPGLKTTVKEHVWHCNCHSPEFTYFI